MPQTHFQVSLAYPDFSQHKVQDLFNGLGPIAIFSAKHHWTAPRVVRLRKREHEGFGFSVRGDSPVIIAGIDSNSIAEVTACDQMLHLKGSFSLFIKEHLWKKTMYNNEE